MSETLSVPFDVRLMNATAAALLVVFCAVALVLSGGWAANQGLFALRAITVQGELRHSNAVTLRANVLPRLEGSFLTIDLQRARQAFEASPWVRRAVVHREFPNRLRVQIQEHQAVAFWGAAGETQLLNTYGEVFEANAGEVEHEGLPRLSGPTGQAPQVLALYRRLQPMFEALELGVEQLELGARGSWSVQLDTGGQVELGQGSEAEVAERTRRFLASLTAVAARYQRRPEAMESADLRHADGYALRLRGVVTAAPGGQAQAASRP